jgi:serine/threonine protein phosphatase PrpC
MTSQTSPKEDCDELMTFGKVIHVTSIEEHHEQGRRPSMEDTSIQYVDEKTGWRVYGVFDGHGGIDVAKQLADPVHGFAPFLVSYLAGCTTEDDITGNISRAHVDYDAKHFTKTYGTGSTSVLAIIPPQGATLYLAYVGDSRAVIYNSPSTFVSTIDHKPNITCETKRIENAGGFVSTGYVSRVNGSLAVSRAFGDSSYKYVNKPDINADETKDADRYAFNNVNGVVTAKPSIVQCLLSKHATIILACDGLWDVMNQVDVGQYISQNGVAKVLTKHAIEELCSSDNVSVMCLRCVVK